MANYSSNTIDSDGNIFKIKIKTETDDNSHEMQRLELHNELFNDNIDDFSYEVSDHNRNLPVKYNNYIENEKHNYSYDSNLMETTKTDNDVIEKNEESLVELKCLLTPDIANNVKYDCDGEIVHYSHFISNTTNSESKLNNCDMNELPKPNSKKIRKSNSIKKVLNDSDKERNYLCDICNLTFVTESIFIAHFAAHNDENYFKYGNSVPDFKPLSELPPSCLPFTCKHCGKQFKYMSQLKVHKFSHSSKEFVCNICGKVSRNYFSWKTHEKRHKEPKTFSCDQCGKEYKYKVNLKTHLIHHLGSFKCEICSENFSNQYSLEWHMKRHKSPNQYTPSRKYTTRQYHCEYCNITFDSRIAYQCHISEHKANSDLFCKHCGQSFKFLANLLQHLRQHNTFKCDRCVKSFENEESLNEHIIIHKEDENFKCSYCDKVFANKYTLFNHVNVHLKDFKCNVCPRTFNTIIELQKHAEIHSRNTKKCEYCDKEYDFYSQLAIHMKIHTKLYRCEQCYKSFNTSFLLNKHVKKVHEPELLECNYCNKTFGYQSSLINHMRIHNRKYKCETCQASFDDWPRYDKHLKLHETNFAGFKCEECDKTFKYYCQLRLHVKNHKKLQRCDQCQLSFKHWKSFNKHKKVVHENANTIISCSQCDMVFKFQSQLKHHLTMHNRQYKCHCGKTFNSKTYFENHQYSHNVDTLKCEHCGKEFKYYSLLKTHRKLHDKSPPMECHHCGKYFKTRPKLTKHIFATHMQSANSNEGGGSNDLLKCKQCDKTFKYVSQLTYHEKMHNKRYKCSKCSKSFNSKQHFEGHVRRHTTDKFKCQFCSKVYKYLSPLRYHMRVHFKNRSAARGRPGRPKKSKMTVAAVTAATKKDSLNCKYCGKCFKFRSTLKLHMKKHTAAKPYKCELCDKRFAWKKSVESHLLSMHEHKSKFKCERCQRYFMYRSQYEEHVKSCELKMEYVCKYCNKRLKTRYTYKLHLLQHTGTTQYNCAECDRTFYTKPVLIKHLKTHMEKQAMTCGICGLQFASQFRYNSHLDKHVQQFRCNMCEREFKQKYKLKRHIMIVHQRGASCSCDVCGKLFMRKSALNTHRVKHFIQSNEQLLRLLDESSNNTGGDINSNANAVVSVMPTMKCNYQNYNDNRHGTANDLESDDAAVDMLIPEVVYENQ